MFNETTNMEGYILLGIFNGCSLVGCFFIIFLYISLKKTKYFAFRLFLLLSISDLIYTISLFLSFAVNENNLLCVIQASLISYSSLSSIFMTNCIALSLYKTIFSGKFNIEIYQRFILVYAFVVPIIIAIIPLFYNGYGYAGYWCWIKRDNYNYYLEFFLYFYLEIFIIIIINIYCIVKVRNFLKKNLFTRESNELIKYIMFYPIILIIIFIFGLLDRLLEFSEIITYINIIAQSSIGSVNALVYGFFNSKIKEEAKEIIFKKSKSQPLIN